MAILFDKGLHIFDRKAEEKSDLVREAVIICKPLLKVLYATV